MIYGDITPVTGQTKVVALKMQEKVVSPSTSEQKITADEDYDGLISVIVEGMELQEKTVAPSTSEQDITFDYLYDGLSKVTVNAMPVAEQATPSISVSSAGLITASATQSEGYVAAGTKSNTKQLTTQAAKIITPTTSEQTAVASGAYTTGAVKVSAIPSSYVKPSATKTATTWTPTTSNQTIAAGTYCSGAQTIKGDSNLVAANIAKGVSIFGVTGTYTGAPVLLWTNADISNFGRYYGFNPQTITVADKGQLSLIVEWIGYAADPLDNDEIIQDVLKVGKSILLREVYHREVIAHSKTSIEFASISYGGSSYHCVPVRVWGVQWAL